MTKIRVKVDDDDAGRIAARLARVGLYVESACIQTLVADRLRLAQALRLLRDTTTDGRYVSNVCSAALAECGILDPPDGDHP